MILPNAELAHVPEDKLVGYALNPQSPRGKHKARVFRSALGLEVADADWLRDQVLAAVLVAEVAESDPSPYGERYVVDFSLSTDVWHRHRPDCLDLPAGRGHPPTDDLLHPVNDPIPLHSTVALTEPVAERHLRLGDVGTVVEEWEPGVYEVEFSDDQGRAVAMVALRTDQLMVLHFVPEAVG